MTGTVDQLRERALTRPDGYTEECATAAGLTSLDGLSGDYVLTIPDDEYNRLVEKYANKPSLTAKLAIAVFQSQRIEGEIGVGDTIARLLGGPGEAFKKWFEEFFGRSCGCVSRQRFLNEKFPYK